ncbi:CHAP domain-containing protein [Fructobacillus sp. M1-13]|uniref:CHAP domain-containing protein n=1 Tax=Fructobacillus papyriferae TaxID=2713171 RepID=A0ABS5QP03_9LACO|nr:CHAP domain-containing protein [Fructobacillus papyriferae]MBS9334884.1 CHAP domain-containing protein [Fructobacillus papyriferae]MCD2158874.1 CHAP domain-containing protein [Fructobacillus papyriferae]
MKHQLLIPFAMAFGVFSASIVTESADLPATNQIIAQADENNGFRPTNGGYEYYQDGQLVRNSWAFEWGNKYYIGSDGRALSGVQKIGDDYFYFGDDGTFYARHNQWVSAWGLDYYVNDEGKMVEGIQKIGNDYYYFGDDHRFFKRTNTWASAWGHDYYVGSDGRTLQGFQKIGNEYYYFGEDNTHYKRTDQWIQQWGHDYYVGSDGRALQGVQKIGNDYYYFGEDNTYYKRTNQWVQQWGHDYYAGPDGQFYHDVKAIDGTYYAFDSNGYYKLNSQYVRSSWGLWYMFGQDGRIITGWKDWYGSRYYFDPVSYLKVTGDHWIDGRLYHFDSEGRLQGSAYPHSQASANNTYPFGYCTYYVKQELPFIGNYWGNARHWSATARQHGYVVDNHPSVGSAVVFQPGQAFADSTYGHVAVVKEVQGNRIRISEMNARAGFGGVSERWVDGSDQFEYIH